MKRFGSVCGITEAGKAQYIKLHKKIPEDIATLIYACNLRNYSIFVKDNLLFTYYEYVGVDYDADMRKMSANPINREWWDLVYPLMAPLSTRADGEWWANMTPIFFQA